MLVIMLAPPADVEGVARGVTIVLTNIDIARLLAGIHEEPLPGSAFGDPTLGGVSFTYVPTEKDAEAVADEMRRRVAAGGGVDRSPKPAAAAAPVATIAASKLVH